MSHPRSNSPPKSPTLQQTGVLAALQPSHRTIMDAYKQTSWVVKEPETKFGAGTRPPLNNPNGGPGYEFFISK
jgi:hypothetical protein